MTIRNLTRPRAAWFAAGVLAAAALLLLASPVALAQYYGGQQQPGFGFNPNQNPFQPTPEALFWVRFPTIALSAVFGFAVGAFFSPALRTFRRYMLLAFLVVSVA